MALHYLSSQASSLSLEDIVKNFPKPVAEVYRAFSEDIKQDKEVPEPGKRVLRDICQAA